MNSVIISTISWCDPVTENMNISDKEKIGELGHRLNWSKEISVFKAFMKTFFLTRAGGVSQRP